MNKVTVLQPLIPYEDLQIEGDVGALPSIPDDLKLVLSLPVSIINGKPFLYPLGGVGTHGNAFNASVLAGATTSPVFDTKGNHVVNAFGHVSAACTVTLMVSQDGVNFYASSFAQTLAGAADFYIGGNFAGRFVALLVSAAVTITATIAAKD